MKLNIFPNNSNLEVDIKETFTCHDVQKYKKDDVVPFILLQNNDKFSYHFDIQEEKVDTTYTANNRIIQFQQVLNDQTSSLTDTTFINSITSGTEGIRSITNVSKCYLGVSGIKMGSSNKNGTFTLDLVNPINIIKIVAVPYSAEKATITINDKSFNIDNSITCNLDTPTNVINIQCKGRCYIKSIEYSGLNPDYQDVSYKFIIPLTSDSYYTIHGIIIPTYEWLVNNKTTAALYGVVYYYDNGTIKKYISKTDTIEDIVKPVELLANISSIIRQSKEFVNIYFLTQCYLDLCKQIFNDRAFNRCFTSKGIQSELILKRDLAWMTINVVSYLSEEGQFYEAGRILDIVHSCNGICNNVKQTSNGCGCQRS